MKELSVKNSGKYISVHLRFEEVGFHQVNLFIIPQVECLENLLQVILIFLVQDMVAFSCCVYGGGKKEEEDMNAARERGWKGKFTKPGRVIRPGAYRRNGKCPLTPLEVILVAS